MLRSLVTVGVKRRKVNAKVMLWTQKSKSFSPYAEGFRRINVPSWKTSFLSPNMFIQRAHPDIPREFGLTCTCWQYNAEREYSVEYFLRSNEKQSTFFRYLSFISLINIIRHYREEKSLLDNTDDTAISAIYKIVFFPLCLTKEL